MKPICSKCQLEMLEAIYCNTCHENNIDKISKANLYTSGEVKKFRGVKLSSTTLSVNTISYINLTSHCSDECLRLCEILKLL